jgi:hypothetical protein
MINLEKIGFPLLLETVPLYRGFFDWSRDLAAPSLVVPFRAE